MIFFAETDCFAELIENQIADDCRMIRMNGDIAMILSHCRIKNDGEKIVFITNMGEEEYNGIIFVIGGFKEARVANPKDGEVSLINDASSEIDVRLKSGEGKFFVFI